MLLIYYHLHLFSFLDVSVTFFVFEAGSCLPLFFMSVEGTMWPSEEWNYRPVPHWLTVL